MSITRKITRAINKKTFFAAALIAVLASAQVLAADAVSVAIDGTPLETDTPAQIVNSRTLVPMRAIYEALGAEIEWDAETKSITATRGSDTIFMQINAPEFTVNGTAKPLDVPASIIDGRTMVPLRAVSESLDCGVVWNAESKLVEISTGKESAAAETNEGERAWINFFNEADLSPAPISEAKLNEQQSAMHEGARYAFEQMTLPESLFEDDGKLADMIQNDPDAFCNMVGDLWDSTVYSYIIDYMINAEENYSFADEAELVDYIKLVQSNCLLYGSDNIAFSMTKDESSYYTLLEMAEDEYPAFCKYILIVYSNEAGFKYYTLESSFAEGRYLICEVKKDGRGNFGVFTDGPDKAVFLGFIADKADDTPLAAAVSRG